MVEWGNAQTQEAAAQREHDAEDVKQLAMWMQKKVGDSDDGHRRRATICRVIPQIRQRDGPAFSPRVISIGPFHKKATLRAMEEVKWRYLHYFLDRYPETKLSDFLGRLYPQVKDLRDHYSEELGHINDDGFMKMMVLDGCFILEFMFKLDDKRENRGLASLPGRICTFLPQDLLLFENQIPFRVLETLYEAVRGENPEALPELARRTVIPVQGPPQQQQKTSPTQPLETTWPLQIFHLLHLCHHFQLSLFSPKRAAESGASCRQVVRHGLRTTNRKISSAVSQVCLRLYPCCSSNTTPVPWLIPNATKLKAAGVRFKAKKFTEGEPFSLLKVTFSDDGTFEIPPVLVDAGFRSLLRNLIAFEQACPRVGVYFTSYCCLMSCLVDTESDVDILLHNKIFFMLGGRPDRAAALFDEAASGVTLDPRDHLFSALMNNVNRYCDSPLPRWRARLLHDYFGNPWTIISVIAAAVLLALTIVQTFYSPYAYYHPRQL